MVLNACVSLFCQTLHNLGGRCEGCQGFPGPADNVSWKLGRYGKSQDLMGRPKKVQFFTILADRDQQPGNLLFELRWPIEISIPQILTFGRAIMKSVLSDCFSGMQNHSRQHQ